MTQLIAVSDQLPEQTTQGMELVTDFYPGGLTNLEADHVLLADIQPPVCVESLL